MVKPNFTPGLGGLATNRYEYQNHIEGVADRHTADQIDVNPTVNINGTQEFTVANALAAISSYITFDIQHGSGFVSIPDGYDTYHAGTYDNTIPGLDTFLNPLFASILAGSPLPNFARLRDGGILLIPSGTYIINATVNVPPGIILLGEGFGTKLINTTGLSHSQLFNVKVDLTRVADGGVNDTTNGKFMFAKETGFVNLVIADNFVEPKFLGDTSYKIPQNTVGFSLVSIEEGSSTFFEQVKFIGKVTISGSNPTTTSGTAISTNSTLPISTGTVLSIKNCFFDGFNIATSFTASSLVNGSVNDYLVFRNNKLRTYGSTASTFTSFPIVMNICNANITDNSVVIKSVGAGTFVQVPNSFPTLSHTADITIANNNIYGTDTTPADLTSFNTILFSAAPSQSVVDSTVRCLLIGNNVLQNGTPGGGFNIVYNPRTQDAFDGPTSGNLAGYYQATATTGDATGNEIAVINPNTLFNGSATFRGGLYLRNDSAISDYQFVAGVNGFENVFYVNTSVNVFATTVNVLSNGLVLSGTPQTIFVNNDPFVTSLPSQGTLIIMATVAGVLVPQVVHYTGKGSSRFNGCTGTAGTINTNNSVKFAVALTLPTATFSPANISRLIIVKDIGGNASNTNIVLKRNNGGDRIEGLTSDYIMVGNYESLRLNADGFGSWWLL